VYHESSLGDVDSLTLLIGFSYPYAVGHDDGVAENMPIEESGNLLILAYIYVKATGNFDWAKKYMSVFQTSADYLAQNGLYPAEQLSTDDGAGPAPNQTNLAIKAAVGLTSFGALSGQKNYTDKGLEFAVNIYDDGLGLDIKRTHFTLEYGADSQWTTAFNLYPDALLKLNTFNTTAFSMMSSFYPTVRSPGGVPLDSRLDWTKTDWNLWAAATSSKETSDMFINDLHAYLANGLNTAPFSDRYHVNTNSGAVIGQSFDYRARPVVGGEWSILALAEIM
jgi:hypothetical protein